MEKIKNVIDTKDLLMVSLAKFYQNKCNIDSILPIVLGQSELSLRLVDWFVTNYSKKHSIIITKLLNNNIIHFNVYLSYRSQLKAYSKHQFDPFRRRDRINFYYEKNQFIETTIGQLNFFKWIVENGIFDYINKHLQVIEQDMIHSQRDNVKKKDCKKKRNELSRSLHKNMNQFNGQCRLIFD